jgi:nucleotide-binding universal stress UspA family protein
MTQPTSWQRIVIGLDGSEGSRRALDHAIDLARRLDSEVIAVTAVEPTPVAYAMDAAYPTPPPPEPDVDAALRELEDEWCGPLRAAGVTYRAIARLARPADAIVDVVGEEDAGLVVVGRRGLGSVAELLLGSVSHDLSHECPVPLLVVPHPRSS